MFTIKNTKTFYTTIDYLLNTQLSNQNFENGI